MQHVKKKFHYLKWKNYSLEMIYQYILSDVKNEELLFRQFVEEYKKYTISKECPRCKKITDKFVGSTHVVCIYCQLHFCWKCGYHENNNGDGNSIYNHVHQVHTS